MRELVTTGSRSRVRLPFPSSSLTRSPPPRHYIFLLPANFHRTRTSTIITDSGDLHGSIQWGDDGCASASYLNACAWVRHAAARHAKPADGEGGGEDNDARAARRRERVDGVGGEASQMRE
ncbi:Os03g0265633 [Oryza sativa Japonica Group]|uniref:Os03g0265633 protein n=1 Tax=Oryza sativa subsp. japonica TaxID=39947 RepID=A0A0P0VVT6_ORYSJ|nr:Os03g0265633 [Oryza sativa Japonica Group]